MYCTSCGNALSDTVAFCGRCGAQVATPAQVQKTDTVNVSKAKSRPAKLWPTWLWALGGAAAGLITIVIVVAIWAFVFGPKPLSLAGIEKEEDLSAATELSSEAAATASAIAEGMHYPNAQELDIAAVRWEDLAPPDMNAEPEIYLPYRALLTEDLAQKVIDHSENTLFEDNWEQTRRYPSVNENWTMRHYVKGDDMLAIGVLGNLSSTEISRMPGIGLEPGQTLILMAMGNPYRIYLDNSRAALDAGDLHAAREFADQVLAAGGENSPYRQEATDLIKDIMRQYPPDVIATAWLEELIPPDIDGTYNRLTTAPESVRAQLRDLGLTQQEAGIGGDLIDYYAPGSGTWREFANDGETAVLVKSGKAYVVDTTRSLGKEQVPIQFLDYGIKVTLKRDADGIWQVEHAEAQP